MPNTVRARSRAAAPSRSRKAGSAISLRSSAEVAGSTTPTVDANALSSALTSLIVGRLQRYARSGFKRLPTEHLEPALLRLTA